MQKSDLALSTPSITEEHGNLVNLEFLIFRDTHPYEYNLDWTAKKKFSPSIN